MELNKENKYIKLVHVFKSLNSKLMVYENNAEIPFKRCDIFKTSDGKHALRKAIEREDPESLLLFLELEKACHKECRDSIKCFRKVIDTDEKSVKAVEMLGTLYEQSCMARNIMPIISLLPLLLRLLSIIYDQVSDVQFARRYHFLQENPEEREYSLRKLLVPCDDDFEPNPTKTSSDEPQFYFRTGLTCEDYRFAKYYILVSLALMMILSAPAAYKKMMEWKKGKYADQNENLLFQFVTFVLSHIPPVIIRLVSPIVSPVVVVLSMLELICFQFRIATEIKPEKKLELQHSYWKLLVFFGVFEAVEAAEATAQLFLQVWMVGSKYEEYYDKGFIECFGDAVKGLFKLLTLETPESETFDTLDQKALGKFLLALLSILFSALSTYRRTKRESVPFTSSILLMISILAQIVVHISCFLPLYTIRKERSWLTLVLPLGIHYLWVLILKCILDPNWTLGTMGPFQKFGVLLYTVIGSIIINVNVVPMKRYYVDEGTSNLLGKKGKEASKEGKKGKKGGAINNRAGSVINYQLKSENITYHNPSTFLLQTTYFLFKLIENVSVVLVLIFYYKINYIPGDSDRCRPANLNLIACRPFLSFPLNIVMIVVVGTFLSWFSHVSYYRFHGHPWKLSNGPTGSYSLEAINVQCCGNKQMMCRCAKKCRFSVKCDYYLLGEHKSKGNKNLKKAQMTRSSKTMSAN